MNDHNALAIKSFYGSAIVLSKQDSNVQLTNLNQNNEEQHRGETQQYKPRTKGRDQIQLAQHAMKQVVTETHASMLRDAFQSLLTLLHLRCCGCLPSSQDSLVARDALVLRWRPARTPLLFSDPFPGCED